MSKSANSSAENETAETEKNHDEKSPNLEKIAARMFSQAWFSLAFWLSFGLLLEGLIGFRAPAYLQDSVRRELFRLAHAHGTIFSLLLIIAALFLQKKKVAPSNLAVLSLEIGVILMPLGFLLGGVWHYESDPNALVFLAPLGGLLVIFGIINIAFLSLKN